MEFLTHKFGKFYFLHEYANHKVIDALLIEARVRHETINDLPVLPDLASKLEPDILYSSVAGTAAIENNPIPVEGVKELAENKDIEGYTQKHKQEITNLLNCYDILSELSKDSSSISLRIPEDYIRKIHAVVTEKVPHDRNVPGQYRNGVVLVGNTAHGGVYKPPKSLEDIKNLMAKYIEWLNCDEILQLNPFIRAALAHYHFSLIHPFWDGNGRTARLIETAILEGANIKYVPKMLANIYYKNVDEYYIAYSKTYRLRKNNDVSPFLEFVLKSVITALKEIQEEITFHTRLMIIRDFFRYQFETKDLTKRQYQFLSLLPKHPGPFTLKDLKTNPIYATLYSDVTTQTARRDLKKFEANKYLVKSGDKYNFNYRLLG